MVVIQSDDSSSATTAPAAVTITCTSPTRRTSSRIKKLVVKKEELRRQKQEEESLTKVSKPKKQRVSYGKQKGVAENVLTELVKYDGIGNDVVTSGIGGGEIVKGGDMMEVMETGSVCKGKVDENKSDYAKVKDTIRTFYAQFLHFVQLEEQRCKKDEDDKKNTKKDKSKDVGEERSKAKRPDLKALSKMMENKTIHAPENRIGSIPGIDVGHQFFSWCEMVTVGFHNHWLSGIDSIGNSFKEKYLEYSLPITVAIVMSGQYEDDRDNSEDVTYTGHGGNNLLGDKRQIKDQVMKRGNLGLKHSMEQNVPVRVVRGHQSKTSYVGKVYTYDGLYKVVNCLTETGLSGFTVYKFKLKRMDGQPPLLTEQKLTVPQRFFSHFYAVAIFWTTILLVAVWFYAVMMPPSLIEQDSFSTLTSHLTGGSQAFASHKSLSTKDHVYNVWLSVFLLLLMEAQVLRRFYETIYVFNYSPSARMHILGYFAGLFFYTAAPLSLCCTFAPEVFDCVKNLVAEFIVKGKDRMSRPEFTIWMFVTPFSRLRWYAWIGAAIFLWGWVHQFRCHEILSSLREKTEKLDGYVIPYGDWFEYVSSPHYSAEIVIYGGLLVASGGADLSLWLLFAFVDGLKETD